MKGCRLILQAPDDLPEGLAKEAKGDREGPAHAEGAAAVRVDIVHEIPAEELVGKVQAIPRHHMLLLPPDVPVLVALDDLVGVSADVRRSLVLDALRG